MKNKRFYWSLLSIMMAAVMSVGLYSCGDDEDPELSVNITSVTIDANGRTSESIVVSASHTDWYVVVTKGEEWLTANKNGNKVTISAIMNTETSERTGTLLVASTEDSKLSYDINVTQQGTTAYITINGSSSGEHTFPGSFDNGKSGIDYKVSFKIKSNVQWTVNADNESWLNISPKTGNGEVDLSIYPKSENESDITRTASLILSGSDLNATITINQEPKYVSCYVIPANEVALYDRFCWEYTATSNVNTFQHILLSEREYNRMTDRELLQNVMDQEVLKYDDGWISMTGYDSFDERIASNSTYYFVSLATDRDGKQGALKKIKLKTPAYLDADQDAYVSFDKDKFVNTDTQFQFEVKKEGYCNTYHLIYGVYDEYLNSAVFAFEINYYLKYNKKHWLAKNDYYEWDIITSYPNDHTFSYTNYYMYYYTICFGYGWGMFNDGKLSSDLLGFQVDTDSSSSSMKKIFRNTNEEIPKNVVIKRSEVLKRAKQFSK